MTNIKMNRIWQMPNKNTFSIPPIAELIHRRFVEKSLFKRICAIDPFCNNSPFKDRCITNDIDPSINADFHMDALEFLKCIKSNSCDLILFDPPYSPRQISESYIKHNMSVNMKTTQSSFWGNLKSEISRVSKIDGIVITCGWNSGGIGKKYGFKMDEILLVPHGGWHNDTIVTVEYKV